MRTNGHNTRGRATTQDAPDLPDLASRRSVLPTWQAACARFGQSVGVSPHLPGGRGCCGAAFETSLWGTPAWWRGERVPGYLFGWGSGSGPASLELRCSTGWLANGLPT